MTIASTGGTVTLGLYDTQSQLKTKADITYVDNKTDPLQAGHKGYATLAQAQAAQSGLAANTVVEVLSDTTEANNGYYLWNGTTLTKTTFSPLVQANNYTDGKVATAKAEAITAANNYTDSRYASLVVETEQFATQAEAAATAANIAGKVYATPSEGIAPITGVPSGQYFNVRSSSNDNYIDEYLNNAGVAQATGKSYPSSAYVQDIENYVAKPFVTGKTYVLNKRVVLSNGDIVRSTVAANTVNPNVDMTGWVKINAASQIFDESGESQQQVNNFAVILTDIAELKLLKPKFNKQVVTVLRNNDTLLNFGSTKYTFHASATDVSDGFGIIDSVGGGRWKICNKEQVNIFNFGATLFSNEIPEKLCDYFISSVNLTKYFAWCEANKLKAKFPTGLTALEAGNYTLPSAGIIGGGKEATTLVIPKTQSGLLFKYNTIGNYSSGRGEPLSSLVITNVDKTQVDVLEINTPSRGCVVRDVNIYSDGKCVVLDDAYYLNFDNCGFFGTWRSNFANITLETDKFTGIGIYTKPAREVNNILFHKCDFKDLKQAVKGQGDTFKGSNTVLFTNTAFERIGDTVFDLRGWNTTFLTAYVEYIDLHKNFKTSATSEEDLTLLVRGGAGITSFLGQNIINLSNVRATDANVCVFNTVFNGVQFDVGSFSLPSGWVGRMQHNKTYSSMPPIHWGGMTPVPSLGFVNPARHITQKDVNQFRLAASIGTQTAHAFVNVDKMGTNYRFVKSQAATQFASTNAKPLGGIDGQLGDVPLILHVKGRQYRVGTGARTEWIEIDGTFRIDKDAPYYATKLEMTVALKGTSSAKSADSFFNATDGTNIADRIKLWRLTTARTDMVAGYNFAYQLGLTAETTGNSSGHNIINDIEIQVLSSVFSNLQAQVLGIYEQGGNFVATPTE